MASCLCEHGHVLVFQRAATAPRGKHAPSVVPSLYYPDIAAQPEGRREGGRCLIRYSSSVSIFLEHFFFEAIFSDFPREYKEYLRI